MEYIEGYRPGHIGRIVEMHGAYYSVAWGSGLEFEAQQAEELSEFLREYRPGRDLLLTAQAEGQLVGSIAIHELPEGARLRWFLLDAAYQGRGIGKELIHRALEFCRRAGHARVHLWTVEGLAPSMGLYERAGFRVVERHADARYGVAQVSLRLELELT